MGKYLLRFDVFGLTERDEMMPNESKRECRARAAMARSGDDNVSNVSLAAKPANSKNENEWILKTPLEKDIKELIVCMREQKTVKKLLLRHGHERY